MGGLLSTCSKDDTFRENPLQINHGDGDANSLTPQSSQVKSKDPHGTNISSDKAMEALEQGASLLFNTKPSLHAIGGDEILSDYMIKLRSANNIRMSLSLITISLITLKQLTTWTTQQIPWMLKRIEDFTQYDDAQPKPDFTSLANGLRDDEPLNKVLRTLTIRSMVIPHFIARMTLAMLITNGRETDTVKTLYDGTMAGTDRYRLFQAPTGSTSNTVNSFDDYMTLLTHELLLSSLTIDRLPIDRPFFIAANLANRIRDETLVTKTALKKNKFFDLLDKNKLFNSLKNDNRLRNMIDAILNKNGVPITTVKNDRALLEPCVTQPESVLSIYVSSSI